MSILLFTLLLAASTTRFVVWATESGSSTAVATQNYIDTISGYNQLSTCAVNVLSTIVRGQFSGCGDGGALTSYTCFCTDSSSLFSSEITSAISESCATSIWSAQASSAIEVFDAYCDLGVAAGLASATASTAASASTSAVPASTAAGVSISKTGSATLSTASSIAPSSTHESTSSGSSRTTAIAAGVAVPVCVLGFSLLAFILWRRHQKSKKQNKQLSQQQIETIPERMPNAWPQHEPPYPQSSPYRSELPYQEKSSDHFPQELPGPMPPVAELDSGPNRIAPSFARG